MSDRLPVYSLDKYPLPKVSQCELDHWAEWYQTHSIRHRYGIRFIAFMQNPSAIAFALGFYDFHFQRPPDRRERFNVAYIIRLERTATGVECQ